MRLRALLLIAILGAASVCAIRAGEAAPSRLSMADLEKLTVRIALFPDPLLAQVLPASTYPLEIVAASLFVKGKESLAKLKPEEFQQEVDKQPWDASVKVVAMCPDALKLLNDDPDWTGKLGEAFLAQPENLMQAIQNLRAKAQASGVLQDTDQQTFLADDEGLLIIPSDPEVIYVPVYDPDKVYAQQLPTGVVDDDDHVQVLPAGIIRFGAGMAVGAWLTFDCRWGRAAGVYGHGYPHYGYAHQAHLVHYGSANMMNFDKVKKKMSHINRTKLDAAYGKFNGSPVTKPRNPIARPTSYTDSQGRWQHNPEHRRGQDYKNTVAAQRAQLSGEYEQARLKDAARTGWNAGPAKPDRPTLAAQKESRPEISDEEAFGNTDWDSGSTVQEESARGNESFDRSRDAYYVGRRNRPEKPTQLPAGGGTRPSGGGRR